jgi:hypothetical protein
MRKREDEMHDDDLEAMREMENGGSDIPAVGPPNDAIHTQTTEAVSQKVWKKKGQKRTTRRVIMRPSRLKPQTLSRRDDEGHHENEDEQPVSPTRETGNTYADTILNESDIDEYNDLEDTDGDNDEYTASPRKSKPADKKPGAGRQAKDKDKEGKASTKKKAGTINPNALSHQNFRSLKIKNKNSKAKGRGRFGRRR